MDSVVRVPSFDQDLVCLRRIFYQDSVSVLTFCNQAEDEPTEKEESEEKPKPRKSFLSIFKKKPKTEDAAAPEVTKGLLYVISICLTWKLMSPVIL